MTRPLKAQASVAFLVLVGAAVAPEATALDQDMDMKLAANAFESTTEDLRIHHDRSEPPTPEVASAHRVRAIAHLARAEHEQAIRVLVDAVVADPDYPGNPAILRSVYLELALSGPPSDWDAQLERLEESATGHPELERRVVKLRSFTFEFQDRFAQAHEALEAIARIDQFYVIGPFDNAGGGGIDEPFPPESTIDLDATYHDSQGRPVRWFRAERRPYRVLDFDDLLDNPRDAVAYAVTHVNAPETMEAVLHLRGSGAFRVWVNGQLVLDENLVRAAPMDLYEVPVMFAEGWNRILIKAAAETEPLRAFVELTDTTGAPLPLPVSPEIQDYAAAPAGAFNAPPRGTSRFPEGGWFRRWQATIPEASLADRMLYIRYLVMSEFLDDAEIAIQDTKERYPSSVLPEEQRFYVLATRKDGEATSVLRNIASTAPELLSARLRLIGELMEQGEAAEEVQREVNAAVDAFEGNPYLTALHGVFRIIQEGAMAEGLAEVEQAIDAAPGNLEVRALHLELLEAMEETIRYEEAMRAARDARPDHVEFNRWVAAIAYHRRDYDEAIKYLNIALQSGAPSQVIHAEKSTVCEQAGRYEEAIAALESGLRYSPQSASLTQMLAALLLKGDRPALAIPHLRRQVALDPTAFEARDLLRRMEGQRPLRDLFRQTEVDDLVSANLDWVPPDANAVRLLDAEDITQYPDGTSEQRHHTVVRILQPGGVEVFRTVSVPIRYGAGEVEIARIRKPDGREVDAKVILNRVSFDKLEVGDLLELRYVERQSSRTGLSRHFWHNHIFESSLPTLESRFSLLTAADQEFDTRVHGLELKPKVSRHGDWTLRVWSAKQLAGSPQEVASPPAAERLAWIDVSSMHSWDEVADWYRGISRARTRSTPAIRKLAEEIAAGASSDSLRIQRVASYVKENVEYVGGLFAEGAYVPARADRVLRKRSGDCKDQTALVVSLLRELGIDAGFALVNSREVSTIPFLPSPRFTHAIAHVVTEDGSVYWIDPTAQGLGFPNVPVELEGASALLVGADEPAFVAIDEDMPAANGTTSTLEVSVDAEGPVKVSGVCRYTGEDAWHFRRSLKMAPDRKSDIVEAIVASDFPGAQVAEFAFQAADAVDEPLQLDYRMTWPGVTFAGNHMIVPIPWTFSRAPLDLVTAEQRRHALVVDSWKGAYREEIRMQLPEGYEVTAALEPVEFTCRAARFGMHFRWEEDVLVIEREMEIHAVRVEPEDYADFRDCLIRARRAEQQQLLLQRAENAALTAMTG